MTKELVALSSGHSKIYAWKDGLTWMLGTPAWRPDQGYDHTFDMTTFKRFETREELDQYVEDYYIVRLSEEDFTQLERIQPFIESLGYEVQSSGKPVSPDLVPGEPNTQWYISVTDRTAAVVAQGVAQFLLKSSQVTPTLVARTHGVYEVII
jgi:hypothetical protein